jgi:hypothetical protein
MVVAGAWQVVGTSAKAVHGLGLAGGDDTPGAVLLLGGATKCPSFPLWPASASVHSLRASQLGLGRASGSLVSPLLLRCARQSRCRPGCLYTVSPALCGYLQTQGWLVRSASCHGRCR